MRLHRFLFVLLALMALSGLAALTGDWSGDDAARFGSGAAAGLRVLPEVDAGQPLATLTHGLEFEESVAAPWTRLLSLLLHAVTVTLLGVSLRTAGGPAWPALPLLAVFALHPVAVGTWASYGGRGAVLAGLTLVFWRRWLASPASLDRLRGWVVPGALCVTGTLSTPAFAIAALGLAWSRKLPAVGEWVSHGAPRSARGVWISAAALPLALWLTARVAAEGASVGAMLHALPSMVGVGFEGVAQLPAGLAPSLAWALPGKTGGDHLWGLFLFLAALGFAAARGRPRSSALILAAAVTLAPGVVLGDFASFDTDRVLYLPLLLLLFAAFEAWGEPLRGPTPVGRLLFWPVVVGCAWQATLTALVWSGPIGFAGVQRRNAVAPAELLTAEVLVGTSDVRDSRDSRQWLVGETLSRVPTTGLPAPFAAWARRLRASAASPVSPASVD